ncbi:EthD family reductase [Bacillus thermotolerans]|uniref:Ethyl tert-butyl ether degradation EthD n=1 Tax=Bacillus thermotolerans TaxID=1221996 RepID=A0A0F5HRP8_BACTR|nr:EthD family reductase [Bacillus thermotolerans]KKB35948.1 Ethyl tert-butyl ether degradation EthD [Bacillus thermotolerans]KKB41161.1 Ethyl tert-butyl ether degradation EthD [Bacillus thermotolerans]KKB43023.1 Ethyl tert-butyl ether degradation EthD [Bacillus thermotolerans]
MAKVVALYKQPQDKEKFDDHYFNVHSPLTAKIPGLREMKVTKFTGSAMGGEPEYYLMCEMIYDSMEDLKNGMRSEEGKASGKDVMGFAGDLVTLMIGEDVE